jgi:hypothetical protein
VNTANRGVGGSGQALLDGFHPALAVSVIAGVLGVAAVGLRSRRSVSVAAATLEVVDEEEAEAA